MILPRLFCAVTNRADFGALWAGAGGRGGGVPKASDSEILTKDSARPAPPEGGAANTKGFAPCRRSLKLDDSMIR